MKLTAKLSESDLRKIVADALGADQALVTFHNLVEPLPFIRCEVEDVDPDRLAQAQGRLKP